MTLQVRLNLAQGGIYGLFAIAIGVMGVLTCVRARRRSDPARIAFTWLKVAFTLAALSYGFNFANYMAWTARVFRPWSFSSSYERDEDRLMRLQYGLGSIGFFLEIVSKCALIITSVELGNGYMYALTKQRSRAQTTARSLGFASVIPLIILAIVDTAWDGVVSKEYYDLLYSDNDSYVDRGFDAVLDKLHKINNVRLTIIVLNCAITIGLMVQAAIVQHKYRGIQPAGRGVTIYLVATVLNLVHSAWVLIQWCIGYIRDLQPDDYVKATFGPNLIFNTFAFFIVLVLLFVVGNLRYKGLWSTPQPWTDDLPPVNVPQQQWYHGENGEPKVGRQAYAQYVPAYGPAGS